MQRLSFVGKENLPQNNLQIQLEEQYFIDKLRHMLDDDNNIDIQEIHDYMLDNIHFCSDIIERYTESDFE